MNTGEAPPPCKPTSKINPERVRTSSSYRGAMAKAAKVLKKPEKLSKLVREASHKADRLDKGPIGETKDNLFSLFRLAKAYSTGEYRSISWSNLVLVVASIIYFVTPIDLIPDFLLAMGYFDDAALLAWTVKAIGEELNQFKLWEKNQRPATDPQQVDVADD
ncbi:MAG: DUF1232 domain-containing protein [Porticoccaceae bacterium]|nr:DUF1232 domain-containing protein [Porticoccaceae bacterium]